MTATVDHSRFNWLRAIGWLGAGVASGFAWYGVLKLAQIALRALGVNMVNQ